AKKCVGSRISIDSLLAFWVVGADVVFAMLNNSHIYHQTLHDIKARGIDGAYSAVRSPSRHAYIFSFISSFEYVLQWYFCANMKPIYESMSPPLPMVSPQSKMSLSTSPTCSRPKNRWKYEIRRTFWP
ncbi:9994_t:CDS:2, partial [Acaulospora colombiana]